MAADTENNGAGQTVRGIVSRRVVDLDALTPDQRQALGRRLYRVHCQVFGGVDEEHFLSHVLTPPADRNLVQLYLDSDGELAGYCAVHRFSRNLAGRPCIVIRAEAGLRPDFRGRGLTYWFGMTYALGQKLRHPFVPIYYLGTLVHTSSYHLFYKYFPRIYPAPGRTMPGHVRTLALELIDSFDVPVVDPADPLVRDVGWITLETPQEARLNRRAADLPDVRYYEERNPGYRKGHGLVVLVPLTLANLLGAVSIHLWNGLLDRLRHRRPQL